MTKQPANNAVKTIENENALSLEMEKDKQIKKGHIRKVSIDMDNGKHIEGGKTTEEKIPRNAFLKLDIDAIALRMKRDLTDRCCCADVPCVSIVKEYCESRCFSNIDIFVRSSL